MPPLCHGPGEMRGLAPAKEEGLRKARGSRWGYKLMQNNLEAWALGGSKPGVLGRLHGSRLKPPQAAQAHRW